MYYGQMQRFTDYFILLSNIETGHTQYRGYRYCPQAPGQVSPEEWKAARKAEAASKGASKAAASE